SPPRKRGSRASDARLPWTPAFAGVTMKNDKSASSQRLVVFDLGERQLAHVVAVAVGRVPVGGPGDRRLEIEARAPGKGGGGLGGGEAQDGGLAVRRRARRLPARMIVEAGGEAVGHIDHRTGGGVGRREIQGGRGVRRVFGQALGIAEIAG